eukprot:XP_020400327.1 extensin-like [Zea mays]
MPAARLPGYAQPNTRYRTHVAFRHPSGAATLQVPSRLPPGAAPSPSRRQGHALLLPRRRPSPTRPLLPPAAAGHSPCPSRRPLPLCFARPSDPPGHPKPRRTCSLDAAVPAPCRCPSSSCLHSAPALHAVVWSALISDIAQCSAEACRQNLAPPVPAVDLASPHPSPCRERSPLQPPLPLLSGAVCLCSQQCHRGRSLPSAPTPSHTARLVPHGYARPSRRPSALLAPLRFSYQKCPHPHRFHGVTPPYMSLTPPVTLVTVCVLLHDGQLIRGVHDTTARAHFHATRGPVDPACATRGHDDHACTTRGPVDLAYVTRDPVDPACATRGPVDPACATLGPVDPGSLRQPHARLPPPQPCHYLGAPDSGPSTSTTRFTDPAIVYHRREPATPAALDVPAVRSEPSLLHRPPLQHSIAPAAPPADRPPLGRSAAPSPRRSRRPALGDQATRPQARPRRSSTPALALGRSSSQHGSTTLPCPTRPHPGGQVARTQRACGLRQ